MLFVEVKAPKGRLRLSQKVFANECETNGVAWELWRSVFDAKGWMVEQGILVEKAS
jgi:hypothetical protein